MADSYPVRDSDMRILQETMAAAQAGDLLRAFDMAVRALDDGLEHPLFYRLRALKADRENRLGDAVADFRAALAMAPDDFASLSALGLCLARAGQQQEALAALRQSIALKQDYAPARFNLAVVLEAQGDLAGARDAYEGVLAADPQSARALGALAWIAARGGAWDEARARAQAALALQPGEPAAALALASAELDAGETQAAEGRIRALLESGGLPAHERGVAQSILGDVLDARGEPASAFAAYRAGNDALRSLHGPRMGAGESARDLVERLILETSAMGAEAWRKPASAPGQGPAGLRGHAFLVGFPRSGTTLLGQALGSHPEIVASDEQEGLAAAAAAFMAQPGALARLPLQDPAALQPYVADYWRRLAPEPDALAGKLFLDKLPMNTLGLPLVVKLFPAAKTIFLRRDPRDVVLSCFRRRFVINPTNYELLTLHGAARLYDAVMRLMDVYRDRLELDLHELRYEDLVADFDGSLHSLLGFLGLDWSGEVHGFAGAMDRLKVATPSAPQVARGLYAEGVGQWRAYRAELEPVRPILEPWIERFGYAAD